MKHDTLSTTTANKSRMTAKVASCIVCASIIFPFAPTKVRVAQALATTVGLKPRLKAPFVKHSMGLIGFVGFTSANSAFARKYRLNKTPIKLL